jgi:drug/metabolite transporter (DMT)-like permease
MAVRQRSRINPLIVALCVVGVVLLAVGVVFFVEPGHHVRRGLLAIVLAAGCGVGAFVLQRRSSA